jgi:signal transduction histidine kinase
MRARQRHAAWRILGVGGVLLLAGFVTSRHLAGRFAEPVAALAHDSKLQRTQRQRAEAALETTSAELERVARFSADASHQLKTPVTVLRAGLEEIIARGALPAAEVEEVSSLIHQTYRLSTVIEDLLLLSRMDAGQLKIHFGEVDLAHLIDASLDDLSASPDDLDLAIEADFPRPLRVAGEKRYIALILQNLLENARKYNRAGGRIRIAAGTANGTASVTIGNTTRRPIPPEAQRHIFERFHRGAMGENIPGYGIGLNLARELARLHDGDLRLLGSDEAWTEFEVRFRSLPQMDSHGT